MYQSLRKYFSVFSAWLSFAVLGYTTTYAQTWDSVGITGFSAGEAFDLSMAIDGSGTPYVVYQDINAGAKATVMKYYSGRWTTVGIAGFSAGYAGYTSIAIDGSGTPYVAFRDATYHATVMKFNGSSWVIVGAAGFSAGAANNISIAIDGTGTPYVSYSDGAYGTKATVMKYDGAAWVNVGMPGFSPGFVPYISIAIDPGNTPYVVYEDGGGGKASVMKYNGTNWIIVGAAGFSAAAAIYTTIAIDYSGIPYVIYEDYGYSGKATVMKYNGSSWVSVGPAGFSASPVSHTSIATDGSGSPYVAYGESGSLIPTVMKYNGAGWITTGYAGFYERSPTSSSIAIDGNGIPYVAFNDSNTKATVMKLDIPHIVGPDKVCVGSAVTLSDTAIGGIWSSSNTTIAAVGSSSGIVTGVTPGTVIISYTLPVMPTTITITVESRPSAGSISGVAEVCRDSSIILSDASVAGVWTSSNTSIALAGATGLIFGIGLGSTIISYSVTNSCGTATAEDTITVNSCLAGVTAISEPGAVLSVFPNPNWGLFIIDISAPVTEDAQIAISNIVGIKVREIKTTTNAQTEIQLESPPGIYILTVSTPSRRWTEKIMLLN